MKILLIDDDTELCALLSEYLEDEGFDLETSHDGVEGLDKALTGTYALVILDVMLPSCNGFEVLKKIRRQSDLPVLMLTARGDEVDRIVGLEIGADDYLAKPFNPRELIARMRAIFRRTQSTPDGPIKSPAAIKLCVDDIELDMNARTVFKNSKPVDLTATEFNLLHALLQSAGKVISREDLNKAVLQREYSPLDRSIDVHISKLRKKLSAAGDRTEHIKSIRSEGYLYTFSHSKKSM